MASLLDIAPQKHHVDIDGTMVEVQGIPAGVITNLMARFPDLRSLFSGRDMDVAALMTAGDEIIGAVIASGCGFLDNEAAEAKARSLPIGAQTDLLSAILKATMPGGFGPLAEKLSELGSVLNLSPVGPSVGPVVASPPNSLAH